MEHNSHSKAEVIAAGLGGMGVIMAGQVLAHAGLSHYKHVSWAPSYAVQKRGGDVHCTVVLSQEEIASPLLDQAQSLMLFDGGQYGLFEGRVRPGGLMIVEKAGLRTSGGREDIKIIPVPGLEVAVALGDSLVNNFVLLGVYIASTEVLPVELVEAELQRVYGAKPERLALNQEAFRKGMELAKAS